MAELSVYDSKKALPLGVDDFKKIVNNSEPPYSYIDKSMLIYEIVKSGIQVNLIPRPRRFGKTLNLSMLHQFLTLDADPALFDGFKISQYPDFCKIHQAAYPVLHLDLKDIEGDDYDEACSQMADLLSDLAGSFSDLATSPSLNAKDIKDFNTILHLDDMPQETASDRAKYRSKLKNAPYILTKLMQKHYHKKVVVLIDEYDVPLNHAYTAGYYSKLVSLIRGMFCKLLKGNNNLAFAVLTGCLRISKESIFTGMNNLKVWSGKNNFIGEYFGFTEDEVKAFLDYYQFPEMLGTMRDWYDGFCFEREHVYCPWDVLSFVDQCRLNGPSKPENYWINTSGNDILKLLLSRADISAQRDYIEVMSGKSIWKTITKELTFSDLDNKGSDTIWSMMIATGYLTVRSEDDGLSELVATNREVRWLLSNSLRDWLAADYSVDTNDIDHFSLALKLGDSSAAETSLHRILSGMFTAHTSSKSIAQRETLYQGILLGLLRQNWMVRAEVQSGDGYVDVYFRISDDQGIIIEVKDAGKKKSLESACNEALDQIRRNNYAASLLEQGCSSVLCYGIAFKKADCKVMLQHQDR